MLLLSSLWVSLFFYSLARVKISFSNLGFVGAQSPSQQSVKNPSPSSPSVQNPSPSPQIVQNPSPSPNSIATAGNAIATISENLKILIGLVIGLIVRLLGGTNCFPKAIL